MFCRMSTSELELPKYKRLNGLWSGEYWAEGMSEQSTGAKYQVSGFGAEYPDAYQRMREQLLTQVCVSETADGLSNQEKERS